MTAAEAREKLRMLTQIDDLIFCELLLDNEEDAPDISQVARALGWLPEYDRIRCVMRIKRAPHYQRSAHSHVVATNEDSGPQPN